MGVKRSAGRVYRLTREKAIKTPRCEAVFCDRVATKVSAGRRCCWQHVDYMIISESKRQAMKYAGVKRTATADQVAIYKAAFEHIEQKLRRLLERGTT